MTDPKEQAAAKIATLLKAAFEELHTPMLADQMAYLSAFRMKRYQAHIKAGFTEAQALELCKS